MAGQTVAYDKLSYNNDLLSYEKMAPMSMRPPLANAEFAIMELLWDEQPLAARDIREALYMRSRKAQHGTVQRLLQRLEDKGYVQRDRHLSVHLFAPSVSREEYAADQLESLAERLTDGSLAPLVTHLVEHKRISRDEIERLRQVLDEETGKREEPA